jgi:hypothetical protein
MPYHRGSRKHILDWVQEKNFREQMSQLAVSAGATTSSADRWMPIGHADPGEARLETFGPKHLPDALDWRAVADWWLVHQANVPNWDLAATCRIEGRCGVILMEAKANVPELRAGGKTLCKDASGRSHDNHERIGSAIGEAKAALAPQFPSLGTSRDTHYQLSNRIAFAWRLASLGLPVILIYFGFIGDTDIVGVGQPFATSQEWEHSFWSHAGAVVPRGFAEHRIDCGGEAMWFLVRSRLV